MNRKFMALYAVLVLLAGVLIWQLRVRWVEARTKEQQVLARQVEQKKALAPAVAGAPSAASPAEYVDVAQRTLFSKDRNPNVVVEPPKVEPEPPMPALPHYHGQMAIGEPIAILSTTAATQKGYHVGEKIGDFQLLAFDRDNIKLEWHGKTVEKKLADLVAKEAPPAPTPAAATPAARQANAVKNAPPQQENSGPVTTIMAAPSNNTNPSASMGSGNSSLPSSIGPEIGGGLRACVGSDDSPSGTTQSGYKKNVIKSMFGEICRWEPVK
ncbi:MAG: hypothetical protein ABL967_11920 [Bryobacteraceae bacterium]